MDLIEVTPDELKAIYRLTETLTNKWSHKTATHANLQEFAYEVANRFIDLGFIVNTDITPALVGVGYPDIAIVGRINPEKDLDHDRIRHQIRKEYKEKGKI